MPYSHDVAHLILCCKLHYQNDWQNISWNSEINIKFELLSALLVFVVFYKMSHFMRKPVYDICDQQRRRSACASVQSDQRLYGSLPRQYNTYTC